MLCPGEVFPGLLWRPSFPGGIGLCLSCMSRQIPGVSRRGANKGGFQEPVLLGNMAPNCFHDDMP